MIATPSAEERSAAVIEARRDAISVASGELLEVKVACRPLAVALRAMLLAFT